MVSVQTHLMDLCRTRIVSIAAHKSQCAPHFDQVPISELLCRQRASQR